MGGDKVSIISYDKIQKYSERLGATLSASPTGHVFVNGKHFKLDDVNCSEITYHSAKPDCHYTGLLPTHADRIRPANAILARTGMSLLFSYISINFKFDRFTRGKSRTSTTRLCQHTFMISPQQVSGGIRTCTLLLRPAAFAFSTFTKFSTGLASASLHHLLSIHVCLCTNHLRSC